MTENFAAQSSLRERAVLVTGGTSKIGAGQTWVADAGRRMVPAAGCCNIM